MAEVDLEALKAVLANAKMSLDAALEQMGPATEEAQGLAAALSTRNTSCTNTSCRPRAE
jgi:hypothetical protein